jgi:hypothetical protein
MQLALGYYFIYHVFFGGTGNSGAAETEPILYVKF